MLLVKANAEAPDGRRRGQTKDGTSCWFTPLIGIGPESAGGAAAALREFHPVAFLIEQDPRTSLKSHFHDANEFQLFIAGDGLFEKKVIKPLSLHYASAYNPYGPIDAGNSGLSYFTFRDGRDLGPHFMPEERNLLRTQRRSTRTAFVENIDNVRRFRDATSNQIDCVQLFPLEDDGFGAPIYYLPPNVGFVGPASGRSAGRWFCVLVGSIGLAEHRLDEHSCAFMSPDKATAITAGPSGATVMTLQFPDER